MHDVVLVYLLLILRRFHSGVSIIDFKQVNAVEVKSRLDLVYSS